VLGLRRRTSIASSFQTGRAVRKAELYYDRYTLVLELRRPETANRQHCVFKRLGQEFGVSSAFMQARTRYTAPPRLRSTCCEALHASPSATKLSLATDRQRYLSDVNDVVNNVNNGVYDAPVPNSHSGEITMAPMVSTGMRSIRSRLISGSASHTQDVLFTLQSRNANARADPRLRISFQVPREP
jgi:hypothetical protein